MPAYRFVRNIWGQFRQLVDKDVWFSADAGAPAVGLGANVAGKGSLYIDTTNGVLYLNTGTKAAPLWSAGAVASNGGLGFVGNAKMTYEFAVDGGAISTITPTNSPTVPINAIILGGTIDITTTLTSGGAATIALGLGSGAQVASLKAATAVASWTAGQLALVPVFTAATYVKVAASTRLTMTIAAATLTAGKFDVNVAYIQGN